jgi:exosome complex RNA-binding protein Rrp42 (RNase PH superfamily)
LDPESLCILTGKFVWQITIDCIVIRDAGNIIDAVLNGSMAALMDMKKPLVNVERANVHIL